MWEDIEIAAWLNRNLGMAIAPWEVRSAPGLWLDLIFAGTRIKAKLADIGQLKVK